MSADSTQRASPTGAEDLDAVSTIATEGPGILGELVEEGIMVPSEGMADVDYHCIPCGHWLNGHEQAIKHLFCKAHLRSCTRISARSFAAGEYS